MLACFSLFSTLISFSKESSLPRRAFLSMILIACICPSSFDSANLTCENAPVPKTSFRSYLSSTVGVLGFTTSSVFFTSGFFFPPNSGMVAPKVFAFAFVLFVCLVFRKRSLALAGHCTRGPGREFTGGALVALLPVLCQPPTLSPDFLSLEASRLMQAPPPSLHYL